MDNFQNTDIPSARIQNLSKLGLVAPPKSRGLLMMNNQWLDDLQCLVARFSHLRIGADIASLSMLEAWGLYRYLSRLAGG